MRHLRVLWFKQVLALDSDGGLALSAFSIRITYVNALQLAIGVATYLVVVLRV